MKSLFLVLILGIFFNQNVLASCLEKIAQIAKAARLNTTKIEQQTAVILAVRKTFETLKSDPEVLSPEWQIKNKKSGIKSVGFGYNATRAVYHLLGGKNAKLVPMVAVNPRAGSWAMHWWLHDKQHRINIDPTHDQLELYAERVSYSSGKEVDFDSSEPPVATQKIIIKAIEILSQKGLQPNGQQRPK